MQKPKIEDYDGWRNSATGIWYFEEFLPAYARESAVLNGKAPGSYKDQWEDFAAYVRNAGHIDGVEYVINLDPYEETRNENSGSRAVPASEDRL